MISTWRIIAIILFAGTTISAKAQVETASRKMPMVSLHRGASQEAPENTLTAITYAMELKIDFIELDVRTTADGKQVIMHDGSLLRTTGKAAKVQDVSWSAIQKLSAGSWFAMRFTNEKVPLFEDVCKLVSTENKKRYAPVNLYVDCKDIDAKAVVNSLKKYGLIESAIFYGNIETLIEIKRYFDEAKLMPTYPGENQLDELIHKINPYAVDMPYEELNEATIALCHSKGIKVFSDLLGEYDNDKAYQRAINFGIDLIQTDDARAVLYVMKEVQTTTKK